MSLDFSSHSFSRHILFDTHSIPNRPDWPGFSFPSIVCDSRFENPYRLYFGSHSSNELLVAVAKSINGPWAIQDTPAISLHEVPGARGHLGSPEVSMGRDGRVHMLFHAPNRFGRQLTFSASSRDGLKFRAKHSIARRLPFYARLFKVGKHRFAMAKGGEIFRQGLLRTWSRVNNPFVGDSQAGTAHNYVGAVRHCGVVWAGGRLYVFFTKTGDAPERILCAELKRETSGRSVSFRIGEVHELMAPSADWEGVGAVVLPSASGPAKFEEHALRDPYPFVDEDGELLHLFYVAGGESCLGKTEMSLSQFRALMSSTTNIRAFGSLPLVCVVGFSHAGTTLMYRMLGRAPRSGSFPFETEQFLRGVRPELAKLLVDSGRYLEAPQVLIEKTPRHASWVSGIRDLLPGTKFVFMIRDIRDVAGSQLKRLSDWRLVKARLDKSVEAFNDTKSFLDVQVVRYEDLVANPEQVLMSVSSHTGLTFSRDMLTYFESLDPWQGHSLSSTNNSRLPPEEQNNKRRAYQMTKPIQSSVGHGRLSLSEQQLEDVETRYAKFQTENGYH